MKYNLLLVIAFSLLSNGCTKEEEISSENTTSVLTEYFKDREIQSEVFEIDANNGGEIKTGKGSIIFFPPNALITQNGQELNGNIRITIKEIFSREEMIFSGVFPQSSGQVLNSGGEIFISATQNGKLLRLNKPRKISVSIPNNTAGPDMEIFFGGPIENGDVLWQLNSNPDSIIVYNMLDSLYQFNSDSMGWINIDSFLTFSQAKCSFNFSQPGLNNGNTRVFAILKGFNSAIELAYVSGRINNSKILDEPLAMLTMNILVISNVNGQLYSGAKEITPVNLGQYTINMSSTTAQALDKLINSLP